jgi:hypothetical protein
LIPFAIQSAENLTAALESGDLANAKEAYKEARPIYEQIEVRLLYICFKDDTEVNSHQQKMVHCRSWLLVSPASTRLLMRENMSTSEGNWMMLSEVITE